MQVCCSVFSRTLSDPFIIILFYLWSIISLLDETFSLNVGAMDFYISCVPFTYTGWPRNNGTVDTVDFQDFALINCYFFTLLDRASSSHYINTKIIKFGWELATLCVISYGLSSSGFARFSWVSRHDDILMANPENDSPSEITYKIKVFNQFDDLGVIIMRKRCSIQLGKRDNCCSEQSPKKMDFRILGGHPPMTNEWQIPKMTVHKKLLIKLKVFNQISWSWCYYNKEKMLYPARWKNITVDQRKVQKKSTVPFFLGHPVYSQIFLGTDTL